MDKEGYQHNQRRILSLNHLKLD